MVIARRCETEGCDNPFKARGMCAKHYNQWNRRRMSEPGYVPARQWRSLADRTTRASDGTAVSKVCTGYRREAHDMPIAAFGKHRGTRDGLTVQCKLCTCHKSEDTRARKTPEQRRASERQRYDNRQKNKQLPGGMKAYKEWLTSSRYAYVDVDVVRPWLLRLLVEHGQQRVVSELTGLSSRMLYTIEQRKVSRVLIATAEALAMHAGGDAEAEIRELEVPHGLDGWSKEHRYCVRCGTCWHLHQSQGLCQTCYRAARTEQITGVPVRTHRERYAERLAREATRSGMLRAGNQRT